MEWPDLKMPPINLYSAPIMMAYQERLHRASFAGPKLPKRNQCPRQDITAAIKSLINSPR